MMFDQIKDTASYDAAKWMGNCKITRVEIFKLRTFPLKTLKFCFKILFTGYDSKYDFKHKMICVKM